MATHSYKHERQDMLRQLKNKVALYQNKARSLHKARRVSSACIILDQESQTAPRWTAGPK